MNAQANDVNFDASLIRKDFPMLNAHSGEPFAYLDSAASSQTPESVISAMNDYYRSYRANVHRGMYRISEKATMSYEAVRGRVAKFLGAAQDEIIFTSGATDGLNRAARFLEQKLNAGDEIVVTEMEHHANLIPWQQLARRMGLTLKHIPVKEDFTLDYAAAAELIGPKTRVVAFTWASNVLGTINDAARLIELARKVGAFTVVDAAQYAGHRRIDLAKLQPDLLAFSAHKMLGPTGVGVLYGRRELLSQLEPIAFGGDMIREVTLDNAFWNESPYRFEAGTPNIAGVIGLGAAVDYLDGLGLKNIAHHEEEITAYAMEKLATVPGLRIIGPTDVEQRVGAVSVLVDGIHPHDLATVLDASGVCIRAGHHCAMPLHACLGITTGTARLSFGPYTIKEEIDLAVEAIARAKKIFRV